MWALQRLQVAPEPEFETTDLNQTDGIFNGIVSKMNVFVFFWICQSVYICFYITLE